MERIIDFQIDPTASGKSVIVFLREHGFSRHILTSMKNTSNALLLNGEHARGNTLLSAGDLLRVRVPEAQVSEKILPVPMDLKILYEDTDLLIINKNPGIPVHPSAGNYENTLANGAAFYFSQKGEPFIFRCINRLDRDTSGALILAKNQLSAALLSAQMKRREIKRTYLALVEGKLEQKGTISAPIRRVCGSTIERCVDFEMGEEAITHYELLAYQNGLSLAEFHLETGRTHQIRVHMSYIGHPLPGDFLYHPVYNRIKRQPLHSFQLEFLHPDSKKPMLFTAPVPSDMVAAWQTTDFSNK
ncbi:MAG: RluA family pseudouridine synthase [Blautia sp.]|nr:RluA family pseudouridine synthase [Blautia sp.]